MSAPDTNGIAELIGPVLAAYEADDQYILTALAERIAASRYRTWADEVEDAGDRETLLACAAREEEVALRVEALRDDAGALQETMRERHPELPEKYAALFSSLSLRDQFALQAAAERLGAATWRSFAKQQADSDVADVLEGCAPLEEASAEALEAIIAKLDSA